MEQIGDGLECPDEVGGVDGLRCPDMLGAGVVKLEGER